MVVFRYDEVRRTSPLATNKLEVGMVSTQRNQELEAAFKKGAAWGARIKFLDTIDSVEELDELAPLMQDTSRQDFEYVSSKTLSLYREWLTCWPDPKLDELFTMTFPLVSARLDTPQKIRIFLRGAEFRRVDMLIMASVFEDIIKRHEVGGQKVVRYENCRGNSWCDALRIVYHTEFPAWTLTDLMLPGKQSSSTNGTWLKIDWRTKEERAAVGEQF